MVVEGVGELLGAFFRACHALTEFVEQVTVHALETPVGAAALLAVVEDIGARRADLVRDVYLGRDVGSQVCHILCFILISQHIIEEALEGACVRAAHRALTELFLAWHATHVPTVEDVAKLAGHVLISQALLICTLRAIGPMVIEGVREACVANDCILDDLDALTDGAVLVESVVFLALEANVRRWALFAVGNRLVAQLSVCIENQLTHLNLGEVRIVRFCNSSKMVACQRSVAKLFLARLAFVGPPVQNVTVLLAILGDVLVALVIVAVCTNEAVVILLVRVQIIAVGDGIVDARCLVRREAEHLIAFDAKFVVEALGAALDALVAQFTVRIRKVADLVLDFRRVVPQ